MKNAIFTAATVAMLLACRPVVQADDGGAAIKNLLEHQHSAAGPACKMFSKREVAGFLGKPVKDGHLAGMGSGCQWETVDSSHDPRGFIVNRRPKEDYNEISGAPKFRTVKGIGTRAYIADDGGWNAGAVSGNKVTLVLFQGEGVPEATALKALRIAITR
jgi:hypothetical protein